MKVLAAALIVFMLDWYTWGGQKVPNKLATDCILHCLCLIVSVHQFTRLYCCQLNLFMIGLRVIPACPVTDSKLACLSQTHSILWHVFTEPTDCNTHTLLQYIPSVMYPFMQHKYDNLSMSKWHTTHVNSLFLLTAWFINQLWTWP